MNKKHIDELIKVRDGLPYTKKHDFWSPLSRANIVDLTYKPNKYIEKVEITAWGKVIIAHGKHLK